MKESTGNSADILKQMKKDFGANSMKHGNEGYKDTPRIPTGIFAVDLATGGGFPLGRCSTVYGPESSNKTNLVLQAIGQGQKLYPDKRAVFIDAENGYDDLWAQAMGVDTENLIVGTPEYAEQAVDMIEAFLYAEDVFCVALDSIAALSTQNEIESTAEKVSVGGASLVIGKLYKKATASFNRMRNQGLMPPAFIGINQTRYKIGCFDYTAPVWLSDGTVMPIGQIVNQRLPVEVLSVDQDGYLVPRKVIDWANNGLGEPDEWLKIKIAGGNSGTRMLKVTRGHSIFTPTGEVLAGDLVVGDLVSTEGYRFYTDEQHEIILGSMLGDGSLRFEKGSTRGHLRIGHGLKQREYAQYKADQLRVPLLVGKRQCELTTKRSLEFGQYSGVKNKKGTVHFPQEYVDRLTPRALAIWYMDDGNYSGSHEHWGWGKCTISAKVMDVDSMARIAKRIEVLGGGSPTIRPGVGFLWSGGRSRSFMQLIAPYIPDCMRCKLKDGIGGIRDLEVTKMDPRHHIYAEPVLSIEEGKSPRQKYDITVEGEHNYLVNGVQVHNTMYGDPEVMPGGNAIKFASSFIMRLYGKNEMDKKIHPVMPAYKKTSVIIKKWKFPILATTAEFMMQMVEGAGRKPGYVEDWNTVSSYLKELDYLSKGEKSGWVMFGEPYKTLIECKEALYGNEQMLREAKAQIIEELLAANSNEVPEEVDEEVDEEEASL